MDNTATSDDRQQRIWQVLASIPEGKVVSYGQLAEMAGLPGYARFAGTALKKLPQDSRLPWHRVINAAGMISFPKNSPAFLRQKNRLEAEGVRVHKGKVSMIEFRWQP